MACTTRSSACRLLLASSALLLLVTRAPAHGLMSDPPQRGILAGNQYAPWLKPVDGAPIDFFAHFPAGDKSTTPGAGKLSQERAAAEWTPFNPSDPAFNWRAGVCGDLRDGTQHHLKGGKYYFDAHIVRTYPQGGFVHMKNAITAHHNGFVEVHVCDVSKCPGGDISERCFSRTNACIKLQRTPLPQCDSAMSPHCGPIDRNHRGRWYLPCSNGARYDEFGGDHMVWSLPAHLYCAHCVLHWYWVSANTCNPPGVVDYFEGPDAPRNWGACRGQGGAVGGYAKNQLACGGRTFPEEYHQCADIRIERVDGGRSVPRTDVDEQVQMQSDEDSSSSSPSHSATRTPTVSAGAFDDSSSPMGTVTPTPSVSATLTATPSASATLTPTPSASATLTQAAQESPFLYVSVVADGKVVSEIAAGEDKAVDISEYDKVSLEAVTSRKLGEDVYFSINGKRVWKERNRPYFLYGNRGRTPNYWDGAIVNEQFELKVSSGDYEIDVRMTLIRAASE